MKKVEVELKIQTLERAYDKLKEAIDKVVDDLDRDGAIQRFEFTVELIWKTLKALLEYKKVECFSPRDCVKNAFRYGIIDDDDIILDMLDDRNLSSHIYDEKEAEKIYKRVKEVYINCIDTIIKNLKESI